MNVLNELVNRTVVFFTLDMDVAMARITKDEHGRFGSTHNQSSLQAFGIYVYSFEQLNQRLLPLLYREFLLDHGF